MECKHWVPMIYLCFYFRQEPKCLNQWWCGWGQGPVQTSRWFPGYKHYYICSPSCMQLLHLCCAAYFSVWLCVTLCERCYVCERCIPQEKNNRMCFLFSSRWWEWFRCRGGARENGESQTWLYSQHARTHTSNYPSRLSCHTLWSVGNCLSFPASRWVRAGAFLEYFYQEWLGDCDLRACTLCTKPVLAFVVRLSVRMFLYMWRKYVVSKSLNGLSCILCFYLLHMTAYLKCPVLLLLQSFLWTAASPFCL